MSEQSTQRSETVGNVNAEDGDSVGLLDRIKTKIGMSERQSLRSKLEQLLRRGARDNDDSFSPPERTMLRNVLRFGALRVEDVMVPRADIVAIDENASVAALLHLFETAGHSRVPLYRETLDEPVGMVHVKDLLGWLMSKSSATIEDVLPKKNGSSGKQLQSKISDSVSSPISLKDVDLGQSVSAARIRRDVLFVPPSMPVADLLLRMQSSHVHLALVVDEYGGTDGLVSIEDLVEEIVGEIEDEHDVPDGPLLRRSGLDAFFADARTPIEELKDKLEVELALDEKEEDEIDTLGGLVFALAGRVPVRGEIVRHPSGVEFEVLDADPRRIKRLRIHLQGARKNGEKQH